MASRRGQGGLSLLEFTLALLIVSVLILMAFERIAAVRSEVERAEVRHTVAAMRSALALRFAELAVRGEITRAAGYEGANALALLSPPPPDYLGARAAVTDAEAAAGSWYYAAEPGLVVYRPRDPDVFARNAGERLYWRAVAGGDSGGDRGYDDGSRGALALVRTDARGRPLSDNNEAQHD